MNLQITYSYERQYLPTNRHRKPRTMVVEATSSFPVRELSEKDFPLAFEVRKKKFVFDTALYQGNSDFRVFTEQIRTHDGKLYCPNRVTHGAAISRKMLTKDDIEINIGWSFRKYKPYADLPFGRESLKIKDNKQEVYNQVVDCVQKLVYFDGCFWHECREPMYVVITFGLGHNHGGTGIFIEDCYNGNISKNNYFTALQRDEAIAYGIDVYRRRGDTKSIPDFGKELEIIVHMPEKVRRNPALDHGDGDPFLNKLYAMTQIADSAFEAECLVMAATAQELKHQ